MAIKSTLPGISVIRDISQKKRKIKAAASEKCSSWTPNRTAFSNRTAVLLENVYVEFAISRNLFSLNDASPRKNLRGYV